MVTVEELDDMKAAAVEVEVDVAHHLHGNHRDRLTLGGVDLTGHDRGAGLVLGDGDLTQTAARS